MADRVTDSCTDADFVPVGSHIGELGVAYTAMIAPVNPPIIYQNRICGLDVGNAIYLTSERQLQMVKASPQLSEDLTPRRAL